MSGDTVVWCVFSARACRAFFTASKLRRVPRSRFLRGKPTNSTAMCLLQLNSTLPLARGPISRQRSPSSRPGTHGCLRRRNSRCAAIIAARWACGARKWRCEPSAAAPMTTSIPSASLPLWACRLRPIRRWQVRIANLQGLPLLSVRIGKLHNRERLAEALDRMRQVPATHSTRSVVALPPR